MELIELNINKVLLLENYKFKNPYNDIDFLNSHAMLHKNSQEQLELLKRATHKVEKFHSYFHFEQSFFHLQLAKNLLKNKKNDEANLQLELAIFQDHCNNQAIALLEGKAYSAEYERIYKNFDDFVEFATEEEVQNSRPASYWLDYAQYLELPSEQIIKNIIEKIREHHLNYHIEAAKLYVNRAIIFYYLNLIDLAKNDLRKAFYLDSKIKDKHYYTKIEKLINSLR